MAQEKLLFDIEMVGASETISELSRIDKLLKDVAKAKRKEGADTETLTRREIKLRTQKKLLSAELNKQTRQWNANKAATKAAAGSYDQLVERNKALVVEMRRLSPNTKNGRKQIKALSKEIFLNTKRLKEMDKQMGRNFRNVGNYKTAITDLKNAFLPAAGVAGLAMLIKGVVNVQKEFEQRMAKVRAISGAGAKGFKLLSDSAKELGGSTQFTASQVAELQLELSKLGFTTEEILQSTEAILNLSLATGEDLAQAAVVAASTVRGFGLTAQDTTKVTDVMAASFTQSALDLNKFSTAMATVAPVAQSAGVGIEETTAIIAKIADAGVDASTAGTALRNIFLELAKQGLTFDEAMTQIGASTNKNATALDLFGKRGATVATIIANNITEIDKLTESFKNSSGAAADMAEIVGDTLQGKLNILQSTLEGIVLNEGGGFNDFLKDAVDFLTQAAVGLGNIGNNFELIFKGVTGASEEARIALINFGKTELGTPVKQVLKELDKITSDEFFGRMDISKKKFIDLFKAQGEEIKDILPLWETYARLRAEQRKNEEAAAKASEEEAAARAKAKTALDAQFQSLAKTKFELEAIDEVAEREDLVPLPSSLDIENGIDNVKNFINTENSLRDEANQNIENLVQQSQDAIFDIVSAGINRRAEAELEVLKDKSERGLITNEQFEKQSEDIRREAFQKQKQADIAQALINGAVAITKTIAQLGGLGAITPAGGALIATIAAQTAVQTGIIAAQKFAKGGLVDGGVFEGASHAQGGIKFASGGRIMEAEGGEAIINKRSTSMYKPLLSAINQAGGGKKFALGGVTPTAQLQSNLLTEAGIGQEIARQLSSIKVVNVVSDTTDKQISINNVESEAIF